MSVEEGYTHFIKTLTNVIDECAPEKDIIIKKIILLEING